jgi:hypothetical protein
VDEYVIPLYVGDIEGLLMVRAKTVESALRKMKKILSAAKQDNLTSKLEEIERN